jgi:hypothetical protein
MNFNRVDTVAPSVTADIQQFSALGNQSYSIVASVSSGSPSLEELTAAISDATNNRIRVVEDSVRKLSDFGNLFGFFAVANTPSVEYKEAANMKVLAANIFEDDENCIWKVVGTGDERRLVQTSNDNLDEILAAKLSRRIVTASYEDHAVAKTGDFCVFFNTKSHKVESGFAAETDTGIQVFSTASKTWESAPEKTILGSIEGSSIENQPIQAQYLETAVTQESLKKMVDYMGKLYEGTEFYAKMVELINNRLGMGEKGGFSSSFKGA